MLDAVNKLDKVAARGVKKAARPQTLATTKAMPVPGKPTKQHSQATMTAAGAAAGKAPSAQTTSATKSASAKAQPQKTLEAKGVHEIAVRAS